MSRASRNLLIIVSALITVGIVLLFSSSIIYAGRSSRIGDPFFFLRRQVIWLILSILVTFLVVRTPLSVWRKTAPYLLAGSVLLLLAVFIPGLGTTNGTGARRWLRLGSISLQASEVAKIALPVFMAWFLASDPDRIKRFFGGFLPAMGILSGVTLLIMIEPDLGSAILVGTVLFMMLFIAGARLLHILPVVMAGGAGAAGLLAMRPYQVQRVMDWWNMVTGKTEGSYHIQQSLVALGSGGLCGEGPGRGIQKYLYLPEGHTDFILANIGEELGFLGTAGILLLFVCFGLTGWSVMRRCRDPFHFHLCFGLTAFILLQAVINFAVVTAMVPTKGIPLPLLSYGGSSLMFTLISVGILIRISESCDAAEREGSCVSSSQAAAPEGIFILESP